MCTNSKVQKGFYMTPKILVKIFASLKKKMMKPLKIKIWKLMLHKRRIVLKLQDLGATLMPEVFGLHVTGLKTHHTFKVQENKTKFIIYCTSHVLFHTNPKIHPNLHLCHWLYFNNPIFKTAFFKTLKYNMHS